MSHPLIQAAVFTFALSSAYANSLDQIAEANRYKVDVDLVAVTFSATDSSGRPIRGLQSNAIRIYEDGIPQRIAAFAEGSAAPDAELSSAPAGTNIFILFDTSDRMYRNIPYVSDAIADLLRHLDPADAIAIYTFSRNLSRAAPLTFDRAAARAALAQNISVGDDTALFNCILLTLRDAAKVQGRKSIVVFSNGPDNKSVLSPEDVGTVAVNEGIPIYIVSTMNPAKDGVTARALERLADRSGGKSFFSQSWRSQGQALAEIHEDIRSSYTAYYYPATNPNLGFRHIRVEAVAASGERLRVRGRAGYECRRNPRRDH